FAGAVQSALALTVVLLFALFGLDPFNDLLIKVNTPGVIGIILLQALAAAGLMVWVIYMVVKHLDVLTGAPKDQRRAGRGCPGRVSARCRRRGAAAMMDLVVTADRMALEGYTTHEAQVGASGS
ncbi:MAG: hypothetical protein ABIW17_06955, partial [Marmoricola sp.]